MKQRVKFWMLDTSTHTVTMELEAIADIIDMWRREEVRSVQITVSNNTILHFNPDHICCIQVDNLEEEVNEGGRVRRPSAKSRSSAS